MSLRLGKVQVGVPIVLAPMAGVTNPPFRQLCREFAEEGLGMDPPEGAQRGPLASADSGQKWAPGGLYVSEMVTSRALVEKNPATLQMVAPAAGERVRSVQLYGVDPVTMGQAAHYLVTADLVDHIDLNFGCPVPKVTRKGGGAALPWKLQHFASIIKNVVNSVNQAAGGAGIIPVTIKMRLGIDDNHLTFLEAGQRAQDLGIAAVALHARTAAQHYAGQARWHTIKELKDLLDVPVLGNGDIFSAQNAKNMLSQTGCAGVVVGRGCQGRPWLFRELSAAMQGRPIPADPNLAGVVAVILRHAQLMITYFGDENKALREMRKHIGWYLRGFQVGGPTRHQLSLVAGYADLEAGLAGLDLAQEYPADALGPRGRAGGEKIPHLPQGWLATQELDAAACAVLQGAELDLSGG